MFRRVSSSERVPTDASPRTRKCNSLGHKGLRFCTYGGAEGNRTLGRGISTKDTSVTDPSQNHDNSQHILELPTPGDASQEQNATSSEHFQDSSRHQKYAPSMHPDLDQVVDAWDRLPDDVKAGILAAVRKAAEE